jgi:mannose-6-phosphate isomerase-like protein (cupin superfamily)
VRQVSGYTIKNLKDDVEDQAVKHGLSPDLEARFAREDLGVSQVSVSYERLGPGFKQPFGHRHGKDEEVYVVVGGGGRMKLGDELVDVRRWDAIRVSPETFRSFAAGPDGLELLAIGPAGSGDARTEPAPWD